MSSLEYVDGSPLTRPEGFKPVWPGYGPAVSEPTTDSGAIQQTDKHGRLLDEELQHETEGLVRSGRSTRAEEFRDPEPAGEDQPTGDRIYPEDRRGNPEGMTQDDVDERADIARNLGTSAFPGDRDQLVAIAEENEATDHVVGLLRSLPAGETFENVQDVARALGLHVETHRF
jgi:Protein of unknown function (DUF2795)